MVFLRAVTGFVIGSVPFSVLAGRLLLKKDIREYGDGNPGSMNAWRAGGWKVGLPAGFLDYLKGAVPVGCARVAGVRGWGMFAVALAPVAGHAFSPFLCFRGGKALATTFGVWTGLLSWRGPLALGCCTGSFALVQENDAWSAVLGLLSFTASLAAARQAPATVATAAANTAVVCWKQLPDLRGGPSLRPLPRSARPGS